MKAIFLDIDGVLNNYNSKSRCCGYVGIDNDKVKLLRKIVEETGAQIILSSSWRDTWYRDDKSARDEMAKYMDRKLAKEKLYIIDKTEDFHGKRGREINDFLERHPAIDKWIVLDDVIFNDFEEYGIMEHLVNTEYYSCIGGLTEEHVKLAIKMLSDDYEPANDHPCKECPSKSTCDQWDATFCCTLCHYNGLEHCDDCNPMDV